jgi:membrane protease YdiL (CAAX protease family)
MPQTFLMGLALGGMTLATRSILPAMMAHAAHNATPVLLVARSAAADLEAADATGAAGLPPWAVMAAIGCLLAGGGLLAASRRGRPEKGSWT